MFITFARRVLAFQQCAPTPTEYLPLHLLKHGPAATLVPRRASAERARGGSKHGLLASIASKQPSCDDCVLFLDGGTISKVL